MVKSDSFLLFGFYKFWEFLSNAIENEKKARDIIKGVLGILKHTPLHYGTKTYEEIDGK